jgi:CDP-diacylglycerol--glycerol-3-phosphate 3-phosphatidyltransferase
VNTLLRQVPFLLTTLRLLMAPRWVFILCLLIAFVSDIYDGIIARRLGVATSALRRYDSVTDLIFYLAILWSAWALYPQVVIHFRLGILFVLALDAACHAVSLIRFGRPASTHCYSAKAWGILLFASFVDLLGFSRAGPLLWITIAWGCVADLECLFILLSARAWPSDVRSLFCRNHSNPV